MDKSQSRAIRDDGYALTTSFPRAARRFKTSEAAHRHLTKLRARGLMAGGKVVRWQP